MQYLNNLVQEFDTFLLNALLHYDVVLKLHNTEYDINTMTWDHDLEGSISSWDRVSYDKGSKLPKAHLE